MRSRHIWKLCCQIGRREDYKNRSSCRRLSEENAGKLVEEFTLSGEIFSFRKKLGVSNYLIRKYPNGKFSPESKMLSKFSWSPLNRKNSTFSYFPHSKEDIGDAWRVRARLGNFFTKFRTSSCAVPAAISSALRSNWVKPSLRAFHYNFISGHIFIINYFIYVLSFPGDKGGGWARQVIM